MKKRLKGMRLPLRRRPDPVLTKEELVFVEERCTTFLQTAEHAVTQSRVSQTMLDNMRVATSAREKFREVLASLR